MTDPNEEIKTCLTKLTYATNAVLCEYGSGGVPMIERLARAADEATQLLQRLGSLALEANAEHFIIRSKADPVWRSAPQQGLIRDLWEQGITEVAIGGVDHEIKIAQLLQPLEEAK